MNFFNSISEMLNDTELQLNIKKKGDQLTVMIMPKAEIKDGAIANIKPILITGSPAELDEEFLSIIHQPITTATGIMSNIATFEAGASKLAKENEVEKKKAEQDKKEKEAKLKKYAALMTKFDAFKKDNKIKEAVAVLKQAKDFSDKPESVDKMIKEMVAKLSQGSIFSAVAEEADTTDYLADFKDDQPEGELTEENNYNEEEEA